MAILPTPKSKNQAASATMTAVNVVKFNRSWMAILPALKAEVLKSFKQLMPHNRKYMIKPKKKQDN